MMFWSGEQLECLVRHLFHQRAWWPDGRTGSKKGSVCCTNEKGILNHYVVKMVLKVITILGMYPQDLACISLRIGSQWTEKCLIKPCCKCFCPWGWSGSKKFWVKRKPNPLSLWTISFSFIFGGGNNSVVTLTWPHQKSHFPQGRVNLRRQVLQRYLKSSCIWCPCTS